MERRLEGLRWHWIPYVPSGLPLARAIDNELSISRGANVFVLGNHGLVIGGDDCHAVETLLSQVVQRLTIYPRPAQPGDYAVLEELAACSEWNLPDDPELHSLGTDAACRSSLSDGILYPCQAIFSSSNLPALFKAIPCPIRGDGCERRHGSQPLLIVERCGVLVSKTMNRSERTTVSGLMQVVRRISSSAPLRYLTRSEVSDVSCQIASRRREGRSMAENSWPEAQVNEAKLLWVSRNKLTNYLHERLQKA